MSKERDELPDEELKQASGAGKYTVEAQQVVPRGTMKRGVHGSDPGNVGNTDPLAGEVSDAGLGDLTGGAGISAEKTSGRGTYGTGQVQTDPVGEIEPNPVVDVKRTKWITP